MINDIERLLDNIVTELDSLCPNVLTEECIPDLKYVIKEIATGWTYTCPREIQDDSSLSFNQALFVYQAVVKACPHWKLCEKCRKRYLCDMMGELGSILDRIK